MLLVSGQVNHSYKRRLCGVAQGLKEKKLIEANLEKVDRLKPIAKELNCSLAQLALAWCVRNEHVSTVITGATKREQVMPPISFVCMPSPGVLHFRAL